ncbi:MAG TPA: winged helix-turn-helix domain-containing protein [Roseomonas sp.]|jgi:DNA-binding winged helix-turn-helix (wHTH) protein/tetratricopeptide (TPR) repeat protein
MEAQFRFAFGPFVFHALSRRLEKQGELVLLSSRAAELLLLLLTRAGELVTKDELQRAGWGDRVVAENNLTVHMAALRRVLRDGGQADEHIRTEHGRGYRFVGPVTTVEPEQDRPPPLAPPMTGRAPGRISILVPPVESLPGDAESRTLAAEVGRHLLLQLVRVHEALAIGIAAGGTDGRQEREARYVLRISIQAREDAARLIATVEDAVTGAAIWADHFEHRHLGLSSFENEIAGRLIHEVVTELVDREAAEGPSEDAAASAGARYSALRGWSALNRALIFPEDLAEARRWFDRALRVDRVLAPALAGSAYAIVADNIRVTTRLRGRPANDAARAELRRADEMATQAVARAPNWPKAWFSRGYVRLLQGRFEESLAAFERALALDPCDAEAHAYAGHVAFLSGDLEASLAATRHAIALSPRNRGAGLWHLWVGLYDFWQARDELALPHLVRAADLSPGLAYPAAFLASALAHAGRIAEARGSLDAWCEAMGGFRLTIDHLRAQVFSEHPDYLAGHQRLHRGLRLIGVPDS